MTAIFKFLRFTVIVVLILILFRNPLLKIALVHQLASAAGVKVQVDGLNLDLGKSTIRIEGLRLLNPKKFQQKIMMEVPEIYLHYQPTGFLKGQTNVSLLVIRMERLIVEKNDKGELNIDSLKGMNSIREKIPPSEEGSSGLTVRTLSFNIKKVIYADYSKDETPFVKELTINYSKKFTNVHNPAWVNYDLFRKTLVLTSIGEFTNLDLKGKVKSWWAGIEK